MQPKDDDRIARMIFGEDSVTGSRRMVMMIVVVCVVAASAGWWFNHYS